MLVVPAIIPKTKVQFENEVETVAGFSNLIQVDISDGIFTGEKTWPYNGLDTGFFEELRNEEIGLPQWEFVDYEFHLMVKNPENVLYDYIEIGAQTIVAHIESTNNFQEIIDTCKQYNVGIGLAIKPSTDISIVEPFVSQVDFIQVMGSDNLGKHHVDLEESALLQIKKLREKYPESIIGIDIGVNQETKDILIEAGVNKLISGSAILEADDPKGAYEELGS